MRNTLTRHVKKIQSAGDDRNLLDSIVLSMHGQYRTFKNKLKGFNHPSYSRLYLRSRGFKRNLDGKTFRFVTIDQASLWTMEWIKTFPDRYDLIVGIPRSGMLIASIISLKLGKGLSTPELLTKGEFWHSSHIDEKLSLDQVNHILLVDDAVDTGRAMAAALKQIQSAGRKLKVTTASMLVKKETMAMVDLYHKVLEPPRAYEWNILHRKIASYWGNGVLAVDMDGVLCGDCPRGVDQDEDLYLRWIKTARPYLIPAFEIDAIVTNRLEKYRSETEQWLVRNNVRYGQLIMWDVPDKSDRKDGFARHKIDELLRLKPDMFWESTWGQSQRIWRETRIPTLCIDEMTMLT